MEALLVLLIFLLTIVPSALLRGFVVSKLWLWHVVPVFHLAPITVSQAISVSLIFSVLTYHYTPDDKKRSAEEVIGLLLAPFLTNFLLLFMGWVIHVCQ